MPGRRDDGGVPVDLYRAGGYECLARWRLVDELSRDRVWLSVGRLDDSRWYVDFYGDPVERCRAYRDKQRAWDVARAWMMARGSGWEKIDCYPAPRRRPPTGVEA